MNTTKKVTSTYKNSWFQFAVEIRNRQLTVAKIAGTGRVPRCSRFGHFGLLVDGGTSRALFCACKNPIIA
jgi:hypothetical protein